MNNQMGNMGGNMMPGNGMNQGMMQQQMQQPMMNGQGMNMGGQMGGGMPQGPKKPFFSVQNMMRIFAGLALSFFFIPAFYAKLGSWLWGTRKFLYVSGLTAMAGTGLDHAYVGFVFMIIIPIAMLVILFIPFMNKATTNFVMACATFVNLVFWIVFGGRMGYLANHFIGRAAIPTVIFIFSILLHTTIIALAVFVFLNKLSFDGSIIAGFKAMANARPKPQMQQGMMGQPMMQQGMMQQPMMNAQQPQMQQPMMNAQQPQMQQPMMNAQQPQMQPAGGFCMQCGAAMKPGLKFCGQCGAKV